MKTEVTAGTKLHLMVAALVLCRRVDVRVETPLGGYEVRLARVTVGKDDVTLHLADGQDLHYGHAYLPPFRGHDGAVEEPPVRKRNKVGRPRRQRVA